MHMCKGQRSTLGVFYRSPCSLILYKTKSLTESAACGFSSATGRQVNCQHSPVSAVYLSTGDTGMSHLASFCERSWDLNSGLQGCTAITFPTEPSISPAPIWFLFYKGIWVESGRGEGQKLRDTDENTNQENSYMRLHRNFRFSSFVQAPTSPQRMGLGLRGNSVYSLGRQEALMSLSLC